MMAQGISASLIAASFGYWTLTSAGKEKGRVKGLGQLIGLLIILLSLLGTFCQVSYAIRSCQMMNKQCGMMGGMMGMGGGACSMKNKMMGMCPAGHPGCKMDCPAPSSGE